MTRSTGYSALSSATAAERLGSDPGLTPIRRALQNLPGIIPASVQPPASHGRSEEARIIPAQLIEPSMVVRNPGPAEVCPHPLAFLDGIQRHEVVGYAGTSPLILGEVAGAVRERNQRDARTVITRRRSVVIGRPEALAVVPNEFDTIALGTEESPHPLRDLELARAALDRARNELEREVGDEYRRGSANWLIVDGSLAEFPGWANDEHMIGVSKSHATLPFEGADLATYLHLPAGHRSSIFQPASRQWAPVFAWALRLWDWTGKDLFYGLVRVEMAPRPQTLVLADMISRWLLAERAPVSADPRWDRLLYGIHGVEEFLRAGFR